MAFLEEEENGGGAPRSYRFRMATNFKEPRTIAISLIVIVVLGTVWFWTRKDRASLALLTQPVEPERAAVTQPPPREHAEPLESPTEDERAERNKARPEAGGGENQLEHMLRSVVSANAGELKLTPAQIDRLASDYLEYQEIHAEQAARFLDETSFDPNSVSLRLPAYPVEGKVLRDMLYRRLENDFPNGKAGEIKEQLGGFFDNAFRGFGTTEQTFTRSSEVPNAFEVHWEAKVPEGQSAGSVNPEVSFAGSSGTVLLYREQLANGEYRFLGNVVERRFPDTSSSAPR